MSWVLTFVGFAALIVLHELGHFAAAKAVGMRVERFALFFPPLLFKVRRGETEYGVGAIPLGGYVRITGMNPNEDIPPEVEHRAYYRQAVWKRIVVIVAGPLMNVLIAFAILWGLFLTQGRAEPTTRVASEALVEPARGVLRPGDELVSIDGRRGDADALRAATNRHRCPGRLTDGCTAATPAVVVVRRDGRLRTLRLAPRYDAQARRMRIGFAFDVDRIDVGPVEAASLSVSAMWRVTKGTVNALVRIFDPEQRKQISGVVGTSEALRQRIEFDTVQALNVLAIISLSLAIVNLFPFLPLDGGHIFWALAEKVRGRPVPFSVMERAGVVGFLLVIMLFFIGLSNDIDRLRGEGFGVR
ncbi:MAG TPA: site-2 protease family protein [Solirubrobacteraceae bacterium]|nr:site-2 protease family protein [Solirubrobacteraceae bacterium]